MVDNKISPDGELRILKYGKGKHVSVYHYSGVPYTQHIVEVEDIINKINKVDTDINFDDAIIKTNNALKNSKPANEGKRGVSVWDFDHTLAVTKSGVRAKIPKIKVKRSGI